MLELGMVCEFWDLNLLMLYLILNLKIENYFSYLKFDFLNNFLNLKLFFEKN